MHSHATPSGKSFVRSRNAERLPAATLNSVKSFQRRFRYVVDTAVSSEITHATAIYAFWGQSQHRSGLVGGVAWQHALPEYGD